MTTKTKANLAKWGALGGESATGASKRRSKAHYRRIAKLGGIASGASRRAKSLLQPVTNKLEQQT